MSRRVGRLVAWAALAGLGALPARAGGQQVRVTGISTLRYVDVRLLVDDSVPVADARGDGVLRESPEGYAVTCVQGADFCHFRRSGERASTVPATQDLAVSVWGLGRGVRGYARVRGRGMMGQRDLWPRGDDAFDALEAWAEVDRGLFRVRAGRQWKVSGLGYYNFDGASLLLRPLTGLTVEAYGGWSLAHGLNEPRTSAALAAVEPFAPDDRGVLVGVHGAWRPSPSASLSLAYQRDVRADRKGLYAEQLAADGVWRRDATALTGTLDVDVAMRAVNEARLTVRRALGEATAVGLTARHYEPFFEAWTIWGAFDPVGFDEVTVDGSWSPPGGTLAVRGQAGWRRYPDAHASATFGAYHSTAWRATATASLRPSPDWLLTGRLATELGFGASRDDGALMARRTLDGGAFVGATLQAFQTAYEFRVSQGTVWGLGVDGALPLGSRARVVGGLTAYRHHTSSGAPELDWSQLRGSLRAEWTVGPEPGIPGGRVAP